MTTNGQTIKDLYDFLASAELLQYKNAIETKLKVMNVSQLRYVEDEDLIDLGMARPEIRRLRQFYKREYPTGAFVKFKKMLGSKSSGPEASNIATNHHQVSAIPQISSRRLISENQISLLRILGKGEFSIVQQGVWTKDSGEQIQVAVKCLTKESLKADTSSFLREAEVMQSLDHINIVKLYGIVVTNDNVMMITELAPMRSLHECLIERSLRPIFTLSHISTLVLQIVDAMSYLEHFGFVHRDLATRNILMFTKDHVKVSDFGLSRAIGVGSDYYRADPDASLKLAIAWCAPECINFLKFTSASDVWSFGVVLWEIFSFGLQPWAGLTGVQVLEMVDEPNCKRLTSPEFCTDDWYQIMNDCWKHAPELRPKFSQCHVNISQIKPTKVIISSESIFVGDEYLRHEANDIVTVLSRHPVTSPRPGLWRGLIESTNQFGFFDPALSAPYFEITGLNTTQGPFVRKSKTLGRAESARNSVRSSRRITPAMISGPKDDVRHLGHVGYDGVIFGDVGFIADRYDQIKTRSGDDSMRSSCISLPLEASNQQEKGPYSLSVSSSTLVSDSNMKFNEFEDLTTDLDFGVSLMDEVLGELTMKREGDSNEDFQNLIAGIQSLANKNYSESQKEIYLEKADSQTPTSNSYIASQNYDSDKQNNFQPINGIMHKNKSSTSYNNKSFISTDISVNNESNFEKSHVLKNNASVESYNIPNTSTITNGISSKKASFPPSITQSYQQESNNEFKVPLRPPTHPKPSAINAVKSTKLENVKSNFDNYKMDTNRSYMSNKIEIVNKEVGNITNGIVVSNGVAKPNGLYTNGKTKLDLEFTSQIKENVLSDNEDKLVRTSMDAGSLFDSSSSSSTKDVFEDYQGLDASDMSDNASTNSVEISKNKLKETGVKSGSFNSQSDCLNDESILRNQSKNLSINSRLSNRLNQNIRTPAGIPCLTLSGRSATESTKVTGAPIATDEIENMDDCDLDDNPLRRLRQSSSGRPMMTFRPMPAKIPIDLKSDIRNPSLSILERLKSQEK